MTLNYELGECSKNYLVNIAEMKLQYGKYFSQTLFEKFIKPILIDFLSDIPCVLEPTF